LDYPKIFNPSKITHIYLLHILPCIIGDFEQIIVHIRFRRIMHFQIDHMFWDELLHQNDCIRRVRHVIGVLNDQ
jgi:hypothetical protein